jgi:septal ring factor EnvC (AmiA/AmiB activator)
LDYKGKKSEAVRMCIDVLESETSYAVALYHNLVHFDRAVNNEKEHNTCKADLEKANKTISEMRTRMDGMEEDLKKMKKELKELREPSGGCAPIKLTMDHAAPTGTEDKET